MNKSAVAEASAQLQRMAQALDALGRCTSHEQTVEVWTDFLFSATRFYNKLRKGSKGHPQSWTWSNGITNQRRTDKVLQYIKNARDAEEHGIEVGHADEKSIGFGFDGGFIMIDDRKIPVTNWPKTSYLVPVVNEGVKYYPPNDFMESDRPQDAMSNPRIPVNVGRYALSIYERWLKEAKALPEH